MPLDINNFQIFAHRGGMGHGPENALSTIAQCLAENIGAIEIDLMMAEGEIIATHDRRLGRTLSKLNARSSTQLISEISISELKQLSLYNGESPTTLKAILNLVGQQTQINLELKSQGMLPTLLTSLDKFISSGHCQLEQFLISSFDLRQLQQLQQLRPEFRRGVLLEGIPLDLSTCATQLQAESIHLNLNFLSPELIADAKQRNLKIYVYTVNEPEDIQQMINWEIDGIFTDYPQRAKNFCKNMV